MALLILSEAKTPLPHATATWRRRLSSIATLPLACGIAQDSPALSSRVYLRDRRPRFSSFILFYWNTRRPYLEQQDMTSLGFTSRSYIRSPSFLSADIRKVGAHVITIRNTDTGPEIVCWFLPIGGF